MEEPEPDRLLRLRIAVDGSAGVLRRRGMNPHVVGAGHLVVHRRGHPQPGSLDPVRQRQHAATPAVGFPWSAEVVNA